MRDPDLEDTNEYIGDVSIDDRSAATRSRKSSIVPLTTIRTWLRDFL